MQKVYIEWNDLALLFNIILQVRAHSLGYKC